MNMKSEEIKPAETGPNQTAMTEQARRTFLSNTLLLMAATLASRVLGLFREIVLAAQFGTADEAAAYQAAFRIPDTLYLLIIGGALGSALIPVFSGFLGKGETARAWQLANSVVNWALLSLAVVAGITWLFAPFIVDTVLAPGFNPQLTTLTVDLTRLLLVQPFFLGLGGIALALLNSHSRFIWPALAPLVYNLLIIGGALFLTGPFGIFGVVYGVLAGSVLYLAVQLPALFKLGFYWRPGLEQAEGFRAVAVALGPRLLGQAAFQLNFFVATNLGSQLVDGSQRVAAFGYAYQLFMLPHGIFALSVATVAFPLMSRQLGANDRAGMKETLTRSLRQIFFFTLPAAMGLGLLSTWIVRTLFEAGKFDTRSTELVSMALFCFSFGLVAYGVVEILTRAFYALQDTFTPVIVALLTVALNFVLSLLLVGPLLHAGLALALALSTTGEMILLWWLLRRKIGPLAPAEGSLLLPVLKIIVAADAMGLALFGATRLIGQWEFGGKFGVLFQTIGLVAVGACVYALAAYLLKIDELRGAVRRFLRRGDQGSGFRDQE